MIAALASLRYRDQFIVVERQVGPGHSAKSVPENAPFHVVHFWADAAKGAVRHGVQVVIGATDFPGVLGYRMRGTWARRWR